MRAIHRDHERGTITRIATSSNSPSMPGYYLFHPGGTIKGRLSADASTLPSALGVVMAAGPRYQREEEIISRVGNGSCPPSAPRSP